VARHRSGSSLPDGRPWAVAQHAPHEGPGLLAEVLAEAGLSLHIVRLDCGDPLPDPRSVAGVVVMGGAMGVHDTDEFPWLEAERRWLARTVASGVPVLGVCLGAQQLAAALGATVRTGPAPEVGVGEVALTDAGRADPVLGPEGDRVAVIHWHGDTFDIPPGAVHLATGDRYPNQAFRYGDTAYGLQFHVEVDEAMADAWAPELPAGVTLDAEARRPVEAAGRGVLRRFVEIARRRSVSPLEPEP
jgi:GMP synthase (glutamine-hydrolysing)